MQGRGILKLTFHGVASHIPGVLSLRKTMDFIQSHAVRVILLLFLWNAAKVLKL